jgi:hypothetical protein
MTRGKHAFTLLLLVSFLTAFQTVQSQQYATTTITGLTTQTLTTSGPMTPVYVGPPVTILGTHGVCGEYFEQAFNGTAGEILTGSVSAKTAVNVYVMTSTAFQAWQHQVVAGGTCTPSNPVAIQTNTTSYTLSTVIPASGTYDLVVNNLSESTVTVGITANLASAAPSLVTATGVVFSTATQTLAQTISPTTPQTTQTGTSGGGPDMTTLGAVIFAIIIIAAAAYLAKTGRKKTQSK